VIEGTRDAVVTPTTRFEPYPFVCKPGDVTRSPCWISPYHLRLDWQMWFGALGSPSTEVWLLPLLRELLAGNPQVERLLGELPFDGAPPRYLRVRYFRYELVPPWAEGDAVWRRTWVRDVIGPVSLVDLRR